MVATKEACYYAILHNYQYNSSACTVVVAAPVVSSRPDLHFANLLCKKQQAAEYRKKMLRHKYYYTKGCRLYLLVLSAFLMNHHE